MTFLFELLEQRDTNIILKKDGIFLMQKYHLMERMVFDMKIIKEELPNDVYISNLSKKIKLSELEDYLKTL